MSIEILTKKAAVMSLAYTTLQDFLVVKQFYRREFRLVMEMASEDSSRMDWLVRDTFEENLSGADVAKAMELYQTYRQERSEIRELLDSSPGSFTTNAEIGMARRQARLDSDEPLPKALRDKPGAGGMDLIIETDPEINAVGVISAIRLHYVVLDHLSREEFVREIAIARASEEAHPGYLREAAEQYGYLTAFEEWEECLADKQISY